MVFIKTVFALLFKVVIGIVVFVPIHAVSNKSNQCLTKFVLFPKRAVERIKGFSDHCVEVQSNLKIIIEF